MKKTAEEITQQTSDWILAAMNAKGKSYTIPEQAGGASVGDELAELLAKALGMRLPDKKKGQWAREIVRVVREWGVSDEQAVAALKAMMDDKSDVAWKTYSSPFQKSFKEDYGMFLGRELGGGKKGGWYAEYADYIDR